jgi:hypothetical protein
VSVWRALAERSFLCVCSRFVHPEDRDVGLLAGRSEITGIATFARSRRRFGVLASTGSDGEAENIVSFKAKPVVCQAASEPPARPPEQLGKEQSQALPRIRKML